MWTLFKSVPKDIDYDPYYFVVTNGKISHNFEVLEDIITSNLAMRMNPKLKYCTYDEMVLEVQKSQGDFVVTTVIANVENLKNIMDTNPELFI